jgi:hypothetical protein
MMMGQRVHVQAKKLNLDVDVEKEQFPKLNLFVMPNYEQNRPLFEVEDHQCFAREMLYR